MRLEISRTHITIRPDGPVDEGYIEEVLGLRQEGDAIPLIRKNVVGTGELAGLDTQHGLCKPKETKE